MVLPEDVDVLIIGSGPTGLMLANCFNHSTIKYRIVEKKGAIVPAGQADSLKYLTMQIFHSLGISNLADEGACQIDEVVFWDPNESGQISRSSVVPDMVPGLKAVREVTLNQGKIEQLLLKNIREHRDLNVEYGKVPSDIYIDETALGDVEKYPFIVMLDSVDDSATKSFSGLGMQNGVDSAPVAGIREAVRAKYVVGCDGVHSWTRKRLAIPFDGDQTDSLWGVLDIIPKTNFPDIRKNCVIRSVRHGNLMLIPREKRIVRFYVQLLHANTDLDLSAVKSAYSVGALLRAAQRVLSPYELTYDYCDWWSVYQVGQRVSKKFSIHDRLFLAGDAVHTHSPKAGQGMNTGIQDAYNLGWKLVATLQQQVHPKILSTYESERRPVAEELISFDKGYAQRWAKPAETSDSTIGANGYTKFQAMYMKNMTYTTSLLIQYPPSTIVFSSTSPEKLKTADGLTPGMRLPNFQILNQADAVPSQIHQILKSDGRFRVLVFTGGVNLAPQAGRLQELAAGLSSPQSFVHAYRPASAAIDSRIEIITILASARSDVELQELPAVLHPWSEEFGWDYWKVFVDDRDIHGDHGEAYKKCGIDKNQGSLVVIRPDGYVGMIAELTDLVTVNRYFAGFMIPVEQGRL